MGEILLYSQIPVGKDLLYSHFSGGKSYYIAIFLEGGMAREKGYYTTPEQPTANFQRCKHPGLWSICLHYCRRSELTMIMSKNRVTPLKTLTMPKSELMGALIGAR
jgi:hypothetical protein